MGWLWWDEKVWGSLKNTSFRGAGGHGNLIYRVEELPKNRGLGQCTDLRGDLARNSGADTQIYTYIRNIYIYIYIYIYIIYIYTHIYIYIQQSWEHGVLKNLGKVM